MPEEEAEEGPDLTSVNSAPEAIDEDGEEEDNSPVITNLLITGGHTPPAGESSGYSHTDIRATIATARGHEPKRIVIPGGVTAKRLCELLANVDTW